MDIQDQISADKIKAMRAAFERAVQSIRDATSLKYLEQLVADNDVEGIIKLLGLDQSTFAPLTEAIRDSYSVGGSFTADVLTPIPTPQLGAVAFRFDMLSPAAVSWVANKSSTLVTEFIEDQRVMLRNVLAQGIEAGENPRATAIGIVGRIDTTTGKRTGGFIMVTSQQQKWIDDARKELIALDPHYKTRLLRDKRFDAMFDRAVKDGKPLTKAQIDKIITRLQARTLKYRADTIARTESITALRAGQHEAMQQAIEKGELDNSDVKKYWDATGDGRTRLSHLEMESNYDDGIQFDALFHFPSGGVCKYAGDSSLGAPAGEIIQCRCRTVYKVDFIGRAKKVSGFR